MFLSLKKWGILKAGGDCMNQVIVVGHKNPDTDSICSSIAYAYLKNSLGEEGHQYHPARIGEINQETAFVLETFNQKIPEWIVDVRTQVRDTEIKKLPTAPPSTSLKSAWAYMKQHATHTMPISDDGKKLTGLITIGSIAESYMGIFDNGIISRAKTPLVNMMDVIDADILCGDPQFVFENGHVLVGAMNPDVMENYIEKGDIVIVGNRYETQLSAIQAGAQCMIVTGGLIVANSILQMAQDKGCILLLSSHDTYTCSRLLNQSIPVGYFMRKGDLVTFETDDYLEEVKHVMTQKRYRNFPVVDETTGHFVGMLSRVSLLAPKRKKVILVDHNELMQSVEGLEEAELLEIIDHHRIGDIQTMGPVYFRNQPLGCTATIIAMIYGEQGIEIPKEIAGLLCSAILSDTLVFKSPTCTPIDVRTAERLAKLAAIDIPSYSKKMFRAGSNLSNKTDTEIFFQDFKQFKLHDLELGIGQINAMDHELLMEIGERVSPLIPQIRDERHLDLVLFMLTDISKEETTLLEDGGHSELISRAFNCEVKNGKAVLPGVVSRKKQVLPPLLAVASRI